MPNEELKESVLVVPRQMIDPFCRQVFTRETPLVRDVVLANSRFLERTIAEHDFTHYDYERREELPDDFDK